MVQHTKVVYDLSNGAIFNDLERPLPPGFKVTPFFDAEYLTNGMRYRQFQWNTNKDLLHTAYSDTKRRTVSLRQLSFLLYHTFRNQESVLRACIPYTTRSSAVVERPRNASCR